MKYLVLHKWRFVFCSRTEGTFKSVRSEPDSLVFSILKTSAGLKAVKSPRRAKTRASDPSLQVHQQVVQQNVYICDEMFMFMILAIKII